MLNVLTVFIVTEQKKNQQNFAAVCDPKILTSQAGQVDVW